MRLRSGLFTTSAPKLRIQHLSGGNASIWRYVSRSPSRNTAQCQKVQRATAAATAVAAAKQAFNSVDDAYLHYTELVQTGQWTIDDLSPHCLAQPAMHSLAADVIWVKELASKSQRKSQAVCSTAAVLLSLGMKPAELHEYLANAKSSLKSSDGRAVAQLIKKLRYFHRKLGLTRAELCKLTTVRNSPLRCHLATCIKPHVQFWESFLLHDLSIWSETEDAFVRSRSASIIGSMALACPEILQADMSRVQKKLDLLKRCLGRKSKVADALRRNASLFAIDGRRLRALATRVDEYGDYSKRGAAARELTKLAVSCITNDVLKSAASTSRGLRSMTTNTKYRLLVMLDISIEEMKRRLDQLLVVFPDLERMIRKRLFYEEHLVELLSAAPDEIAEGLIELRAHLPEANVGEIAAKWPIVLSRRKLNALPETIARVKALLQVDSLVDLAEDVPAILDNCVVEMVFELIDGNACEGGEEELASQLAEDPHLALDMFVECLSGQFMAPWMALSCETLERIDDQHC